MFCTTTLWVVQFQLFKNNAMPLPVPRDAWVGIGDPLVKSYKGVNFVFWVEIKVHLSGPAPQAILVMCMGILVSSHWFTTSLPLCCPLQSICKSSIIKIMAQPMVAHFHVSFYVTKIHRALNIDPRSSGWLTWRLALKRCYFRTKNNCDVVFNMAMYHTGEVEHMIVVFQSS